METARSRTNHSQSQWQQSPWISQEKPDWFTFTQSSPKIYEKKNVLSFIFPSLTKRNHGNVPSWSKSERPRNKNFISFAPSSFGRRSFSYGWTAYFKYHWINKEFLFAMNKLSIVSMIVGLMFLGALFFISGFLFALNLYGSTSNIPNLRTISEVSSHQPSARAFEGVHRPTPPPTVIPQQYASVGGVSMAPPSHRPSQNVAPSTTYSQPIYRPDPNSYPSQAAPSPNYQTAPYPTQGYNQSPPTHNRPLPPSNTSQQYAAQNYPPAQYEASPGPSIVTPFPYQ